MVEFADLGGRVASVVVNQGEFDSVIITLLQSLLRQSDLNIKIICRKLRQMLCRVHLNVLSPRRIRLHSFMQVDYRLSTKLKFTTRTHLMCQ